MRTMHADNKKAGFPDFNGKPANNIVNCCLTKLNHTLHLQLAANACRCNDDVDVNDLPTFFFQFSENI